MTLSLDGPPSTRCLCASMRRAARLLTRRYDEALRPIGLSVSQYELMMTLQAIGPTDQGTLAKQMETDQTTLSRNLKLLLDERWISAAKDSRDRRRRTYRVGTPGLAVLADATRRWRKAHDEMERLLGTPMASVWPTLDRVMDATRLVVAPAQTPP